LNKIVTFVIGLIVGAGSMALVGARERAGAEAAREAERDTMRHDICQSLGYHHAELVNGRWSCMDIDPEDAHEEGDEHEDHHDTPES
jgi:hypothetical protein